jgi:hypothetical protein
MEDRLKVPPGLLCEKNCRQQNERGYDVRKYRAEDVTLDQSPVCHNAYFPYRFKWHENPARDFGATFRNYRDDVNMVRGRRSSARTINRCVNSVSWSSDGSESVLNVDAKSTGARC